MAPENMKPAFVKCPVGNPGDSELLYMNIPAVCDLQLTFDTSCLHRHESGRDSDRRSEMQGDGRTDYLTEGRNGPVERDGERGCSGASEVCREPAERGPRDGECEGDGNAQHRVAGGECGRGK